MRASATRDLSARLEGIQRRFKHWRRSHRVRTRIPDSLWKAAIKAARMYGIHRASKVLRLDYYSLKKRLEEQTVPESQAAERTAATQRRPRTRAARLGPSFLEVAPLSLPNCGAVSPACCECTLDLEDVEGAKMHIHLKGIQPPDLAALARSLWNPAP